MKPLTRRKFIQTSAAGVLGAPAILNAANKGDKLRVAFIGVGGINSRHINDVKTHGDICTAYCDVDTNSWKRISQTAKKLEDEGKSELAKHWSAAKGYQDYRQMFDKEAGNFDAVMIGTPDHTHYPATVRALNAGKHVFTQKPLTHTVWESRQLAEAVDKYKLATQMGNQGHANEGNRLIASYVQGGHLGDITEVHCFTNRPIWPQGFATYTGKDDVPASLDWDNWQGSAPTRDFIGASAISISCPAGKIAAEPSSLSTGAAGSTMVAVPSPTWPATPWIRSSWRSILDSPPMSKRSTLIPSTDDAFPKGSTLKWTFGPKGARPGFVVYWYDGTDNEYTDKDGKNRRHPRLEELAEGSKLNSSGNIYVGTKAKLLVSGDYGDSSRIIPESAHRALAAELKEKTGSPRPARVYEKSIGHHTEWREAAIGNKPYDYPGSNFKYAGPFTETIQLGNVCLHHPVNRSHGMDQTSVSPTTTKPTN